MENLREVLDNLKGTSIKSRQEALAKVREVFSNDNVVANLHVKHDGSADPREWLLVFQALFTAVVLEKQALTKKMGSSGRSSASTSAEKRLSEAASTVRWLTEKTVTYLNNKVATALLEHLLQTIVNGGKLRSLFSLDYIKALRCLANYSPHLEAFDEGTWIRLIEISFNFVLDDPLRTKFENDEDEGYEVSVKSEADDDSHMYDDDEMVTEGSDPSSSRKRNRSDSDAFSSSPRQRRQQSQHRKRTVVSREQVECMALLATLFRSDSAPLLSNQYPYLPSSILARMRRFLATYPPDTSLLHDFVLVLSYLLPTLSLNRIREVRSFAQSCWSSLIALWGSKSKRAKESLIIVLRLLFPFIAEDNDHPDRTNMLYDLSSLLDKEAESKATGEGLNMEYLRFELRDLSSESSYDRTAFIASTFCAGRNFDHTHAVNWAMLDLHADCIAKLHIASESHPHVMPLATNRRGKRARLDLENPISGLLTAIRKSSSSSIRSRFLQTLLFLIIFHWNILHPGLKREIVDILLQLISLDDSRVQSWIFLCFASIVTEETGGQTNTKPTFLEGTSSWDSVWTNAIRRANGPAVCRAACHAAHALVRYMHKLGNAPSLSISRQRMLSEIESMIKDLDVQGPPVPYDSICAFLNSCLLVSSQDMRMYRLHLEDKVLSWLIDCWKPIETHKKGSPTTLIHDFTGLLSTICAFPRKGDVVPIFPEPVSHIDQVLESEARCSPIKNFLLYANLRDYQTPRALKPSLTESRTHFTTSGLAEPKGRERRISAFLQKVMDETMAMWDETYPPVVDYARRCIDLAVIALLFQAHLVLNGIQTDRRVVQSSCRMIQRLTTYLVMDRWTISEKAFVILGLEPMIATEEPRSEFEQPWQVLSFPDIGSGIKTTRLHFEDEANVSARDCTSIFRISLLRIIWQNADVQEAFTQVTQTLRQLIHLTINTSAGHGGSEDKDGFGSIRTTKSLASSESYDTLAPQASLLKLCIDFLTAGLALQSISGEPPRDKELVDVLLTASENTTDLFLRVFPSLMKRVEQGYIQFNISNLDDALGCLGPILQTYAFAKKPVAQLLVIQALSSTLNVWANVVDSAQSSTLHNVQELCHFFAKSLRREKFRSWHVRDAFAQFLSRYLDMNPSETTWLHEKANPEDTARDLLCALGADADVRVRFRAALLCTKLFAQARRISRSPSEVYSSILKYLTDEPDNYEHVLTRMLSLGNVMIVSSEARRGPFWHLLETCLVTNNERIPINYEDHIQCVLKAVAQRLGFASLSALFESYASQLAFSICRIGESSTGEESTRITNIVQFPYRILGYENRRQSALATFRLFSPTNVWNNGFKQFVDHCSAIGKSPETGIVSCFGDIVGYEIARWMHSGHETTELAGHLQARTIPGEEFYTCLGESIDAIIVFILQTLGDQDVSEEGNYTTALILLDSQGDISRVFRDLTRFRDNSGFVSHQPNLPAYSVNIVLSALDWLRYQVSAVDAPSTTYHVLQRLFSQTEHSSLINEQLRLLNAITLWVAVHHSDFGDPTLLLTLIRGTVRLFHQVDLRKGCQSILDWSFSRFREMGHTDTKLSDVLLHIACVANEYLESTTEANDKLTGREILAWIDDQMACFSRVPALEEEVRKALSAWPYSPSPYLESIYNAISQQDLSSALQNLGTSKNRFRLVSRLKNYAETGGYNLSSFVARDFWRLKRCIPSAGDLQPGDTDAFLDLLFLAKGNFDSLAPEEDLTSILSLRQLLAAAMQRQTTANKKDQEARRKHFSARGDDETAKCAIIQILLDRLHGDIAHRANMAYQTLRQIDGLADIGQWMPLYAMELQFLAQQLYQDPVQPSHRSLQELQSADWIAKANEALIWTLDFVALLAGLLSGTDMFYHWLIPTIQNDVEFAGDILPVLIHTLLRAEQQSEDPLPCRQVLSQYFTSILQSPTTKENCSRLIIQTVLHLRNFTPISPTGALSYNSWLEINPLLLARNAISCGMYTSAIMFLELANEASPDGDPTGTTEDVLYQIYQHIDEPDGFYGIAYQDPHRNLMQRFEHEKQWDRAFRFHGAALEAGYTQDDHSDGVVQSFHAIGLNHLANDILQGSSFSKDTRLTSQINYRLPWRTETWDLPDSDGHQGGTPLYLALRAIHRERDESAVDAQIRKGILAEMNHLRELGAENFTEIRQTIQELLCLSEVMRWRNIGGKPGGLVPSDLGQLVKIDSGYDFAVAEGILATRTSLLHAARSKAERQQIGTLQSLATRALLDMEKCCVLELSQIARSAEQDQIALNSIIRAQRLETTLSLSVFEEFANVLWCQKEEKSAVEYLDRLCSSETKTLLQEPVPARQMARILARLGSWSSRACLKKPDEIQRDYFEQAASLLSGSDDKEDTHFRVVSAEIYYEYAIFAEQEYHAINNSPDVLRWRIYRDRKLQEIEQGTRDLNNLVPETQEWRSVKNELAKVRKEYNEDTRLYTTHHTSLNSFLKGAIWMFSLCLHASDQFDDDAPIRLCSLWLSNFQTEDKMIRAAISKALERVPSHKFIFLAHQLSARMSTPVNKAEGKRFQKPQCQIDLQNLVLRMCREHPFHSLYQVYSLKGSRETADLMKEMCRDLKDGEAAPTQNERTLAAADIFDQLRSDPATTRKVKDIERLSLASIQWAKFKVDKKPGVQSQIPGVELRRISNMSVPVMTCPVPVDRSLKYQVICAIVGFRSTYRLCGGNTWPKVTICLGSDGKEYQQLFKGDDLRQDAVMEQVFGLANTVLGRDRQAKRRNLTIRQYKIIPLEPQSGVLEFVENTCPLKTWLDRAHVRYHPKDLGPPAAIGEIEKIHKKYANTDTERLYVEFEKLKQKIRPVMRHYFTEKHKVPISWFAMRLNYTRSVATTSIVGHVLGLGDRHTSNILMDNVSGDVVHIDLGIAFDQGKLLPVPELVPFRMTRDMVDGMGMSGTSGVFHRCAEETLRVMRDGSSILMTVLEVFKYDPLHNWVVSKIKVQRVQQVSSTTEVGQRPGSTIGIDMSSGKAEEAADRALNSVARKLDKALSVQYTVNQLIREATDTKNLARIFKGWSALL